MGQSASFDLRSFEPTSSDIGPREVSDRTLTGRVQLDGSSFEHCVFRNAVLIYGGGVPPKIAGCTFEQVSFHFVGPAGRTLALLQAMSSPSSGLADVFKRSFARLFGH